MESDCCSVSWRTFLVKGSGRKEKRVYVCVQYFVKLPLCALCSLFLCSFYILNPIRPSFLILVGRKCIENVQMLFRLVLEWKLKGRENLHDSLEFPFLQSVSCSSDIVLYTFLVASQDASTKNCSIRLSWTLSLSSALKNTPAHIHPVTAKMKQKS